MNLYRFRHLKLLMVESERFELSASWMQTKRSSKLNYDPFLDFGVGGEVEGGGASTPYIPPFVFLPVKSSA